MEQLQSVRQAVQADASRLAEIAAAAYAMYLPRLSDGVRPAPMDADYAATIRGEDEVWIVQLGSAVTGFIVLHQQTECLLVENVAVAPEFQGSGIGTLLLDIAEERASALHLPALTLYTNLIMTENQRLYERLGYRETSRGCDEGFERVFYEKWIADS